MPTDRPFLTVAWAYLDHFTLTWTHSGSDIFGWAITVWETATTNYLVSYETYNTGLRTYTVPPYGSLADDISCSMEVTALSASGHVVSRRATIVNGHQVSHTFFDGTVYTWPEHDSAVIDFGGSGDRRWLPSMDVTHLAHALLPSDFLPPTAIPLAVTGGVRCGSFAVEAPVVSPDRRISTLPMCYGRPTGFTVPWTVSPPYPNTGALTGHHASAEWLGSPTFNNAYKTIDPMQTEFNGQGDYPVHIDPHTGAPWTRANILSYKWGWAWYAWSDYYQIADETGIFLNPDPPGGVTVRPVRELVGDGRISMFKVYVDYALPPTYDDAPPIEPPEPPPEPTPDPPVVPYVAPSYHLDARYIRRLRRAPHVNNDNTRVFVRRFELDLERGQGLPSGQGADPMVLLRLSRDGGQTWGEESRMAAGALGAYTQRVIARRLGHARDTVFEVTVSDPIAWSLVGAWLDLEPGTS